MRYKEVQTADETWDEYSCRKRTAMERIERMASASAVVIFSMSTCCMCHAVKRLFRSMGVNPTVYEIDLDPSCFGLDTVLLCLLAPNSSVPVPVVFIGGTLIGTIETVMASHISGNLIPLLKEAGALWL